MQEHADYWRSRVANDMAIVLGPVMDPAGAYGIGVIRASDETSARAMADNDPVIKARLGFRAEIHPMPSVIVRT